jgi:release factor glutamine methyltransferase
MLVRVLPDLSGKTVLDIGTGCGLLATYAAMKGALRVTATDVQLESIRNARENVAALGLNDKVEVIHSDVFENVSGRYDVVMANLPFMVTNYVMNDIATETYARFFAALDSHLSPEGTAFLTFASWGDLTTLQDMISGSRFVCERHTESNGKLLWYVFALKLQNKAIKQPRILDTGKFSHAVRKRA